MSKKVKRAQTVDPSSIEGLDGVFTEPAITATPDASSSADVQRLRNELMNGLFKNDPVSVAKGNDYYSPSAPPKRHRDGRVDFEPYNTGYNRPDNPFNTQPAVVSGSEVDLANVGVDAKEQNFYDDSASYASYAHTYRQDESQNESNIQDESYSCDENYSQNEYNSQGENNSDDVFQSAGYYDHSGYNGEDNLKVASNYDESYGNAYEAPHGESSTEGYGTFETTDATTAVHAGPLLDEVASSFIESADRVSKNDLIHILEGFVRILRTDEVPTAGSIPLTSRTAGSGTANVASSANSRAHTQIVTAPDDQEQYTEAASVVDKTAELEEMRRLVVEAQETIIKLLTDRVEDRARIATLETELRLLPDLQEQADRAMAVAFKTEDFRAELHKVKYELQAYRAVSARSRVPRGPRAWLNTVRRWFLKAQGLSMREIYELRQRVADNQEQP